jgi:hypothetical protein
MSHQIYWGETHHNLYVLDETEVDLDRVCREARSHLDFMSFAYYTPHLFRYKPELNPPGKYGFRLEAWKPADRIEREWEAVQGAARRHNDEGAFVTFPGYEWQGDSMSGDHNVIFRAEGAPVYCVNTLAELYACLAPHDALAIPHHTAYRVGMRGKDWSVHDETRSPFVEIFSIHGCSETDEGGVGMWRNRHMGPAVTGGTYRDALLAGLHVGAIGSTDSFGSRLLSGMYGHGLMAVLAPALTRADLWAAFKARRVYGVTGDRIELDFTVDGALMGSCIQSTGPRRVHVGVRGLDAIDRIELLRDERVIATHHHQGAWEAPRAGTRSRFCLRLETGWGPAADELAVGEHVWAGELTLSGGRFLRSVPCWRTAGQGPVVLAHDRASFTMRTSSDSVDAPWQNANVFEFEADPADTLRLHLNGHEAIGVAREFMAGSRVIWYRDESVARLRDLAGLTPAECERDDTYYHFSYKAKLHRVQPEAAYTASFDFVDDRLLAREACYRVRVEQRNGQRAWSSPIWVTPGWSS